jgi:hypothetical protein
MTQEHVGWNLWGPSFWLGLISLAMAPTAHLWGWLIGREMHPAATLGAFAVGEFTLIFLVALVLVLSGALLLTVWDGE